MKLIVLFPVTFHVQVVSTSTWLVHSVVNAGLLIYFGTNLYYHLKDLSNSAFNESECRVLDFLFTYSLILMTFYFVSLCYELHEMTKHPLNNKYNKRANVYHVLS